MASNLVTARANAHLDADLAATVYAALFTANPTDTGGIGDEVPDSNAYARTAIVFGTGAASRTIANDAACEFPVCTSATWGSVTHMMICAAGAQGVADGWYYGELTVAKTVGVGDQLVFAVGAVDVTFTAA